MKAFLFCAAACLLSIPAVQATPEKYDTVQNEVLGEFCQEGIQTACRVLVKETNGECAGPVESGCRYNSFRFQTVDPEEEMVLVPGLKFLGWSRISTVQHCSYLEGVDNWRNLQTDLELERMEACLKENT